MSTKWSHTLPLDRVARKYAQDRDDFIVRGKAAGCKLMKSGNVSLKFDPPPKVPIIITLLMNNAEFSARADLLFDSTIDL
jgi:Domain of unknown function (DUF3786)